MSHVAVFCFLAFCITVIRRCHQLTRTSTSGDVRPLQLSLRTSAREGSLAAGGLARSLSCGAARIKFRNCSLTERKEDLLDILRRSRDYAWKLFFFFLITWPPQHVQISGLFGVCSERFPARHLVFVSWPFGKDQSLSVDRRDLAVEKVMAFDEMSTKIEKLFLKKMQRMQRVCLVLEHLVKFFFFWYARNLKVVGEKRTEVPSTTS